MSTPNGVITTAEVQATYTKCVSKCKKPQPGSYRDGTKSSNPAALQKAYDKCIVDCRKAPEDYLGDMWNGDNTSVEDQLTLKATTDKLLISNVEAIAVAQKTMVGNDGDGCANEYVQMASQLEFEFYSLLEKIDEAVAASNYGAHWASFKRSVGLDIGGSTVKNLALALRNSDGDPGAQASALGQRAGGVESLTSTGDVGTAGKIIRDTFKYNLPAAVANIDGIYDKDMGQRLAKKLGHSEYTLSAFPAGAEAWGPGHPWGWESVVGAFLSQVQALLETTPPESALTEASQDVEPEPGQETGYQKITSGILGNSTSTPKAEGEGMTMGSAAGILKYGAPRYWPPNSEAAKQYSQQQMAKPPTSPAVTDQSYSLSNWASYSSTVLTDLKKSSVVKESEVRDKLVAALLEFISKSSALLPTMAEKAECVYDADATADDVINANDKKLEALKPGYFSRNKKSKRDAIDAMRDHLRNMTDSGRGTFIASPEKLLFKEQCFLLSFIAQIAEYKKNYLDHGNSKDKPRHSDGPKKRLPYQTGNKGTSDKSNASLLIDGDPYGFLNKLVASPYAQRLMDIENWELSSIQPKIRLFKVIYDENGGEKEVEISFDSHFAANEFTAFKDKNTRGVGVGLKYFNFTYDGSNPFSAKKSIKAKLNLFANSFQELLRPRRGQVGEYKQAGESGTFNVIGTEPYKYVELALKTAKPQKSKECKPNQDFLDLIEENEEMSKLNFRLKAVVGLSAPTGLSGLRTKDADLIREALNDSFITLNLTPTVHEFDFDEQGRVNFTINYLAYVEDFFDQKGFNVFADPSGEIGFRSVQRQLQMKTYQRDCGGTVEPPVPDIPDPNADADPEPKPPSPADQLAAIKQKFAQEIETDQLQSVSALIDSMACSGDIYYINIPYDKVKKFVQEGPFNDYAEYTKLFKSGNFISDNAEQSIKFSQNIGNALQTVGNARKKKAGSAPAGSAPPKGAPVNQSKNQIAAALALISPDSNTLSFFYVSTLIDTVLYNIEKELMVLPAKLKAGLASGATPIEDTTNCDIKQKVHEMNLYKKNFERFRVLMGPVEIVHQRPNEGMMSAFVNFGDFPVSVKYFVEWLATKVLQRNEVHYPLTKFLNDFFNNLIREFLNNDNCFVYNIAQKVRVNQAVITAYNGLGDPKTDAITSHIISKRGMAASRISLSDFKMPQFCASKGITRPRDSDLPILNIAGPRGSADTYAPLSSEMNYFVFFAGRTMPTERQRGIRCEDSSRGIHHYLLGRDQGLIKNIKLSKTESPGLAEVRFEQDGYDGLRQLRVVYDVQIDSFASVQTFPGTYIYVDPRGFDPSVSVDNDGFDLTDMGIGGYCMITRSEHEFGEGYANSTIHAKWVAAVDSKNKSDSTVKAATIQSSPGKCGIYSRRQGVNASKPKG